MPRSAEIMSTNLNREVPAQPQVSDSTTESNRNINGAQPEYYELSTTGHRSRKCGPSSNTTTISIGGNNTVLRKFVGKARVFWRRQISIVVSHNDCRDHFGRFGSTSMMPKWLNVTCFHVSVRKERLLL